MRYIATQKKIFTHYLLNNSKENIPFYLVKCRNNTALQILQHEHLCVTRSYIRKHNIASTWENCFVPPFRNSFFRVFMQPVFEYQLLKFYLKFTPTSFLFNDPNLWIWSNIGECHNLNIYLRKQVQQKIGLKSKSYVSLQRDGR